MKFVLKTILSKKKKKILKVTARQRKEQKTNISVRNPAGLHVKSIGYLSEDKSRSDPCLLGPAATFLTQPDTQGIKRHLITPHLTHLVYLVYDAPISCLHCIPNVVVVITFSF